MFSPPKSAKYTLLQQRPTRLHMVAYNTGGLKLLYKKLKTNNRQRKIRIGDYTDETGAFAPEPDMPPMARRYRFLRILGKGQSSVLVKVQDMFQGGVVRAVKVLHTHYTQLGVQESDCLRRINLADPYHMSATLRLCNTFSYHGHYCMTFETLCPEPITYYFVEIPTVEVISAIRKVALRLLQAIGFLQQQNVIHADLKPANILLEKDSELSSVKVVDFGNAIHCIHEELSLYYEDFELQTLLYRAPEVVFGLPFGLEVDMWGLGCVLAELYLNRPLFRGSDKPETLTTMTDFLGLLPEEVFKRGKFFSELSKFTSRSSDNQFATTFELMDKLECDDYPFVDFLRLLLLYNPHERMTVAEAARHPFLAPELALGYVMSTSAEQSYPSVPADHQNYTKRPFVDEQRKRKCLSSTDLLREGTCDTPPAAPKIARIVPILKLIKHDENNISNNNNNNNNNNNKNNNNNNNKYFGADCERRLARRHLTGAICPVFQPHVPMRKIAVIERPKARYPRSRAAYPSHVNDHQAHASSPHVGSESCKPCHHNGSPEVHSRDRMESVVHCRQGQCQHRVQCQYHRNWRLDGCSDCHGRHDGMDDRCHGACVHDLERPGSNAGVLDLSTSYPHPLNSCSDLVPLAYEYIGDSPQLTIPPTQPEAVYHGRHAHLSPSNKPSPRVQVGQRGCCRPSKPMSKHLQNASLNSTFVIQSLKPVSQQPHEACVKRTKSVNSTGETRDCSSHSSVPEPVKADTSKRRGNPAMISKQSWDVIQPIVGNGAPSTVDDQMEAPIRPVVSHVGSRAFKERTKMKTCKPHQLWVEELSAEEALYAVSEGVKSAKGEAIKQKVQRKMVHTTVELVTGKGARGAVVDELKPANKIAIKTKAGGKMSKPIGVTVAPCVLTSVLTRDEEVVMCKKDDTTGLAKEPCQRFSYIPIVFETEDVKAQGPPLKKAKKKPRLEDCPVSTSATNTGKWVTLDRAATIPKSNCKTNRPAQKRQKHSAVKEVERPVQDRLKEAAVTGICAVKEEGDETVVLADGPSRAIMPKTPSKSTTSPKPPSSSVGSSAKSKASRGKSSKRKKSKRSTRSIVKARKYRTPTTNKSQARNSSDEWDVSSDEVVLL